MAYNSQNLLLDAEGRIIPQYYDAGQDKFIAVSIANPLPTGATGNIPAGTTDTGNGLKISGVYNNPLPTVLSGQRVDIQTTASGEIRGLMVGSGAGATDALNVPNFAWANLAGNGGNAPLQGGFLLFNGANYDRQRGNLDTAALVTLTAAAASGNSTDQINYNGRGLQLGINITAITGTTPTLTVTVQGKDAASGVYYTLLASAAISAVGFTLLTIYPGAPTTANISSPQVLPRTFRILYAIGGTTPAVTATIGASVIV